MAAPFCRRGCRRPDGDGQPRRVATRGSGFVDKRAGFWCDSSKAPSSRLVQKSSAHNLNAMQCQVEAAEGMITPEEAIKRDFLGDCKRQCYVMLGKGRGGKECVVEA